MTTELISIAILLAVYGVLALLTTIAGATKNIDILNMQWDWKKWSKGLTTYLLYALAALAFAGVIYAILFVAGLNEIEISGLDVKSLIVVPLLLADVGMAGALAKRLATLIGVDQKLIDQLKAGEPVDVDGIGVELITTKTAKEDIGEIGVELEDGRGGIANDYPEPYRSAVQDSLVDPSSMLNRECTSWSAWKTRWSQLFKKTAGQNHAKNWLANASAWGVPTGSEPAIGAVACWTGGQYGHVGTVEAINGNTVIISEYNYAIRGGFGVREIPKNSPDGYIYFAGEPKVEPAHVPQPTPVQPAAPAQTQNVTYDIPADNTFVTGQTVTAWGRGSSDCRGNGPMTLNFPERPMKIIAQQNGRLALNQYNSGSELNPADITGWWPTNQVRK